MGLTIQERILRFNYYLNEVPLCKTRLNNKGLADICCDCSFSRIHEDDNNCYLECTFEDLEKIEIKVQRN